MPLAAGHSLAGLGNLGVPGKAGALVVPAGAGLVAARPVRPLPGMPGRPDSGEQCGEQALDLRDGQRDHAGAGWGWLIGPSGRGRLGIGAAAQQTGDDRHGEGKALSDLSIMLHETRQFDEAITAYQEAAAIHRETGDRHGEGGPMTDLGTTVMEVGRLEEAITAHQDAAAIFRETSDKHLEGAALNNLELDRAAQQA